MFFLDPFAGVQPEKLCSLPVESGLITDPIAAATLDLIRCCDVPTSLLRTSRVCVYIYIYICIDGRTWWVKKVDGAPPSGLNGNVRGVEGEGGEAGGKETSHCK